MGIENLSKKIDNTIGFINLPEIGRLFNYEGEEIEFFKEQIVSNGLTSFHMSVLPSLNDEEKRNLVREVIETWDKETEELRNF